MDKFFRFFSVVFTSKEYRDRVRFAWWILVVVIGGSTIYLLGFFNDDPSSEEVASLREKANTILRGINNEKSNVRVGLSQSLQYQNNLNTARENLASVNGLLGAAQNAGDTAKIASYENQKRNLFGRYPVLIPAYDKAHADILKEIDKADVLLSSCESLRLLNTTIVQAGGSKIWTADCDELQEMRDKINL